MKFSPSKAMDINLLLAEADLAIERNKAMTSGSGKYRADYHAELATICSMLRDELKEIRAQQVEGRRAAAAETPEQADELEQDHADLYSGIIRAPYRMRSSG